MFDDAFALVLEDTRRDYGETRYNMLASYEGVVLNITFTPPSGLFHLISARMADRKERKIYAENKARSQ